MSAYPTGEVAARVPDRESGGLAAPLEKLPPEVPGGACRLAMAASLLLGATAPVDRSSLNAVGAPLEVGFVWPSGDVRVTVDPCPLGSPRARAAACLQGVAGTLAPFQKAVVDIAASWGVAHEARFGAWIGLRIQGSSIRRKLYLEVPPGATWRSWEQHVVGKPAVLPNRDVHATMIGLDGDRGGLEIYYRCAGLFPAEIDTLLRRFELAKRGAEIASVIQALTHRTIRRDLPSSNMGFSCALAEDGVAQAFTWYSTSRALLGPETRAREAILRVGRANGWQINRYAALTAPNVGAGTPHHGVVGITTSRGGPMQVTATVAALPLRVCIEPQEKGSRV